jgi:hypothetical protein
VAEHPRAPKRSTVVGVLLTLAPLAVAVQLIVYYRVVYQPSFGTPIGLLPEGVLAVLALPAGIVLLVEGHDSEKGGRMRPWDWFLWPGLLLLALVPFVISPGLLAVGLLLVAVAVLLVWRTRRAWRPSNGDATPAQ